MLRQEGQIHYGGSAYITSPQPQTVDKQTVHAVICYRTNWSRMAECGLYWDRYGPGYTAFWASIFYGQYNEGIIDGNVPAGSTHRYHVGYSGSSDTWYWWYDGAIVHHGKTDEFTSCWVAMNTEKKYSPGATNVATFSGVKYKNLAWGSWSDFNDSTTYFDNDPYWYWKVLAPNRFVSVHV